MIARWGTEWDGGNIRERGIMYLRVEERGTKEERKERGGKRVQFIEANFHLLDSLRGTT